jgi:uncharacterized protein (TIGR00369 family)
MLAAASEEDVPAARQRHGVARMSLLDRFPHSATGKLFSQKVLEFDQARGWVRIAFEATSAFLNPAGAVQGGILTAMLDDTMGPALWFMTDGKAFPITIDVNTSFFASTKSGTLLGEGQVLQLGKTIAFLQGELKDPQGRLIARSTCSARVVQFAGSKE